MELREGGETAGDKPKKSCRGSVSTPPTNEETEIGCLVGARVCARTSVRVALQRAVRKRYCHKLTTARAVLQRMDDRADFHARGKGLRDPALTRQASRAAHFNGPLLVYAGLTLDHHQDPAMRVRPLEFLHGAVQLDVLFGVEHRE